MKCVISPKFLYYFVAHVTENKEVQRQNFNVSNKLGLKRCWIYVEECPVCFNFECYVT